MSELEQYEYYKTDNGVLYCGDSLEVLRALDRSSVQCCITSPPYYGLRDYGIEGQLGLEKTPEEYVEKIVEIFKEIKRILKKDGIVWLNLGDSYAGSGGAHKEHHANPGISNSYKRNGVPHWGGLGQPGNYLAPKGVKPKDLIGIPWRVAFALQADGWYLRQDIIWHKPNPMPESVKDRCTKAHEYIFLLSKNKKYYCNMEAIKEPQITSSYDKAPHAFGTIGGKIAKIPGGKRRDKGNVWDNKGTGRNKRSVWAIPPKPYKGAHFATFPEKLIEPCVLAGAGEHSIIIDPFFGAGTTGLVAYKQGRKFIGIDLNKEYCEIAKQRIEQEIS